MNSLRSKITYANAAATVALFLALGGGATAVALSGQNSVRADDIRKNAVRASEIKADSVRASELAPGAVGPINEAVAYGGNGKVDLLPISQKPSDGFVTLDTVSWTEASGGAGAGRTALTNGALEINNPANGGGDATVTVRVLIDGVAEATTYRQTIPEAKVGTVPVQIQDNGFRAGTHSAQLQIQTSGDSITTTNGSFGVISFGPIFNPPAS